MKKTRNSARDIDPVKLKEAFAELTTEDKKMAFINVALNDPTIFQIVMTNLGK